MPRRPSRSAANVDAVRAALVAAGFHEPQVQNFGSSRDIAIRLPPDPKQNGDRDPRAGSRPCCRALDPGAQVPQLDVVGPQVGNELKTQRRAGRCSSRCC